jgi:glycosyltransferase involved in cell wall biosynthesis
MSSSVYQMGGMERVMQILSRELPHHGFGTEVVIPQQPNARALEDWFGYHGARASLSPELALVSTRHMRGAPALASYLRRRNAAVLNVHSPGAHLPLTEMLAGRMAGLPVIVSIHGFNASDRISRQVRFRSRLLGGPLCSSVVAMNRTVMRQQISRGVPTSKVALIYNAVPEPDHVPARKAARQQLGIADDVFVSVTFARLVRDKGIDVLIAAIQQLPEEILSRFRVLIGGSGPELPELQRQVTDRIAHVVQFLGHVDDPSRYYAAADVLVAPSRHEPFGLVFLEAGQHSLPCIGTTAGGIPEVVTSGENGLLVAPENPAQLVNALLELSRNSALRAELGANGRKRVLALHSVDGMANSYARLYTRALRGN